MYIEREINGQTVRIELTESEIYETHIVFVTSWMTSMAMEVLEDNKNIDKSKISKDDYEYIGERAYDIYAAGDGYSEYESVEKAAEEFIEDMEED